MALTKLNSNAIPFSTGSVVQTVFIDDKIGLTLNGSTAMRFMNAQITTKAANSTFLVRFSSAVYSRTNDTSQHDANICAAMGYKIGTASTTSTDYTAITDYDPTRERLPFAGSVNRAFYSHDAFGHGNTYQRFHPITTLYNEDTFAPSQAVGTVIQVACFVKQDSNGNQYYNVGASISGMADSGKVSTLTVQEIAA